MDDSTDPEITVRSRRFHRIRSAHLCCALTRLSQALAPCVPRTEMRIALLGSVCECRAALRGRVALQKTRLRECQAVVACCALTVACARAASQHTFTLACFHHAD
jgi:hypothetical protein